MEQLMETWLHNAPHDWGLEWMQDTRRYVMFTFAVWLTLWVALAWPLRARRIRQGAPPPARQMVFEFLFSIRSVAIFSTLALIIPLLERLGLYPLSDIGARWGAAWFWASLVLMILGHDAYYYWVHRWMHHPRLFRSFHRRHHRSHNPSPFTAYSFDVREAVMMVSFVIIWPLVTPTPWAVVPLFMLHQIFRNTILHSGFELMPARRDGRPMLDWMTTTTHHDLHHAHAGYNHGLYFTWWDRWMGTEHPDYYAEYARSAWCPALMLGAEVGRPAHLRNGTADASPASRRP